MDKEILQSIIEENATRLIAIVVDYDTASKAVRQIQLKRKHLQYQGKCGEAERRLYEIEKEQIILEAGKLYKSKKDIKNAINNRKKAEQELKLIESASLEELSVIKQSLLEMNSNPEGCLQEYIFKIEKVIMEKRKGNSFFLNHDYITYERKCKAEKKYERYYTLIEQNIDDLNVLQNILTKVSEDEECDSVVRRKLSEIIMKSVSKQKYIKEASDNLIGVESEKIERKSNLKVNSKCIMCGSCLSFGYDFLTENNDGSICVKDNTYLKEDSKELETLIEICPVQAFEYDRNIRIKSKEEQLIEIKNQLKNWNGLSEPTVKDVPFKQEEYSMSMPYIRGSLYVYSSEKAAMNAAETQFNNCVYSKINVFILQVISQYRADKVSPYYTYGADTNSIYYKENQKIVELLKQAEKLSKKHLPTDFAKFDIYPYRDCCYKMLNNGELVGDNLVDNVYNEYRSGNYSNLSSYRIYFDTDDSEMYVGQGVFGRDKFVERYCYKNLYEATQELEKDLRMAIGYQTDDIQNHAKDIAGVLVAVYNKDAQEELNKKIAML